MLVRFLRDRKDILVNFSINIWPLWGQIIIVQNYLLVIIQKNHFQIAISCLKERCICVYRLISARFVEIRKLKKSQLQFKRNVFYKQTIMLGVQRFGHFIMHSSQKCFIFFSTFIQFHRLSNNFKRRIIHFDSSWVIFSKNNTSHRWL